MTELPNGWIEATLGDLGDEVRGSETPIAGTVYELYSVPTFPTRKPEVLDGSEIGSSKRPVQPGDVLLCKINPRINRVWMVAEPLEPDSRQIASTEYLVLRTPLADLSRYVTWVLRSPRFLEWIKLSVEGATGSHTRAKSGPILKQRVPLPPLDEQRRIVAALEEQTSRLDAADESLGRARRRLDVLAAAAIQEAVLGEWPTVRLSEVTEDQVYGTSAKADTDSSGVPVLRMGNIQAGQLDLTDLKYLPADHPDVSKLALRRGDLLFNRTNSPELVGKTAVFTRGPEPTVFASYLIRVRLDTGACDPAWASLIINSLIGRRYIAGVRTQQVGQANVNGTKLGAMPIPLPPLDEQQRRVATVERQLSVIQAMRYAVESAHKRGLALRRAILGRAFSGELTPQDPADKPASELLDWIAAERSEASRAQASQVTA